MKKIFMFVAVFSIFIGLGSVAFACNNHVVYTQNQVANKQAAAQAIVNRADAMINQQIAIAEVKAVGANDAQLQIIINQLVFTTDQIASIAKAQCEQLGIQVDFSYVTVNVGGYSVTVDPIRVLDW